MRGNPHSFAVRQPRYSPVDNLPSEVYALRNLQDPGSSP